MLCFFFCPSPFHPHSILTVSLLYSHCIPTIYVQYSILIVSHYTLTVPPLYPDCTPHCTLAVPSLYPTVAWLYPFYTVVKQFKTLQPELQQWI